MIGTALRRTGQGSTFDPSIITWQSAWWASDPAWSNPGNGNAVSTWRDFTGGGKDMTQGTGSKQPTYYSAVASYNNRPALQGNKAAGKFLRNDSITQTAQPVSIVIIGNVTGTGEGLTGGTSVGFSGYIFTNGANWALYANSAHVEDGAYDTNPHLLAGFFNGASSVLQVDGSNSSLLSPGTVGLRSATLLFVTGGTDRPTGGYIAFAGLYAGDVRSDPNWSTFKSAAGTFYGLTVT